MADVYTDGGTVYANLLAAAYDKYLEFQLRSEPIFRQLVDKHPVDPTNVGPTVTLSLIQEFASLATTPLTEDSDISTVAPPAPVRVTVTLNEYGNSNLQTKRLRQLAFTNVEPAIANILGKNMVDTHDALVKAVINGGTHIIGVNGGVVKTDATSFAEGSVASTDVISSAVARDAVALLRRRNVHGKDGMGMYVALIHPDVQVDLMSDTGWLNPHQYVDPTNIYNAELGTYLGARYISSPRCTIVADGATSTPVYRTYYMGAQAIVEATVQEPGVVIGPQIDRLRRFFPIGWYSHMGWAIFRNEAIQVARTASSIGAL